MQALRRGRTPEQLAAETGIDLWFLDRMAEIVTTESAIRRDLPGHLRNNREAEVRAALKEAKRCGLGDAHLGHLIDLPEDEIRSLRARLGVRPVFKAVDTCAAEFPAETPYFYSTYEDEDEGAPLGSDSVVVLGSGPNRIGQGVEFDYCCVRAAKALREAGRPVIFINSNPETVSTDYDTSDRLYFEPLTREHVLNVLEKERPAGVVLQFGGQTPLKLARTVEEARVPILGTSRKAIDAAENRESWRALVKRLGLNQPRSRLAFDRRDVIREAEAIGYPVLVRPSFVLGGRGMRIIYSRHDLEGLLAEGMQVSPEEPVLLDAFLEDAVELDVDAVSDGTNVIVGAVLEHIEEAGVHSGDSSCLTPPYSVGAQTEHELQAITAKLARTLGVKGLLNVQFAVKDDVISIIEANPRASRTVPFVSKATGIPLVRLAVQVLLGHPLPEDAHRSEREPGKEGFLVSVKKPVLPFDRFPGQDTLLGPEMKSTGEVMGTGATFGEAYAKAQLAAGEPLPESGGVFLSVHDDDKRAVVFLSKQLVTLGFDLLATQGTARFLRMNGVPVRAVHKVGEGRPDVVDLIASGEVKLVLNTPQGRRAKVDDRAIRLAATEQGVTCVTTLAGAVAAVCGIEAMKAGAFEVRALQDMRPMVYTGRS